MARLNIAMLAQQEAQVEAVEQQTELEVVGQQAEDAIAEATQQQAEIEQTQQAMDETEEVVQEVEEERQVLEQSQAQGGAEPVAMEALQRAVKRFEKRTGVSCAVKSMGLESFSSKTTRMQSTKIAMEGAVEYIKKLIKMLMDAIAAVWEKVKAFFEKIMVGAERLAKRARQVEAAAKEAQGKTAPADAKVTTASVLAFARKDDKVVEGKAFADELISQTTEAHGLSAVVKELTDNLADPKKIELMLNFAKVPGNKDKIVKEILDTYPAESSSAKVENGLASDIAKDTLLGEYRLATTRFAKNATFDQVSAGYSQVKTQLARNENAKESLGSDVKPLTPEDAKRVAHQAAGVMDSYKDLRTQKNKMEAGLNKLMADAKALEKEKDAPVDQLRVVSGYTRAHIGGLMGLLVAFRAYDVNLCKAALDYAAASVKLASGKGATSTGKDLVVA